MARFIALSLSLAAVVGCGKVTDPDAIDAHGGSDAHVDALVPLTKPTAKITSAGFAGAPAQCVLATPSTGTGSISYIASWTISGGPFTQATKTTIDGDTIPGTALHTAGVVGCTLFATDDNGTVASDPATLTVAPRLAYLITGQSLASIDLDGLSTGQFKETTIGALGVTYSFGDLAWDIKAQKLFMVDGRGAKSLYTVDITTGAATLVGAHGLVDMFGLGYDPTTDTLFGGLGGSLATTNTLQQLNADTGAATLKGGTFQLDGMAFDSQRGEMVGIKCITQPAGTGTLAKLDLSSGSTSALGSTGTATDCGMTYDPFVDLFVMINGSALVTYNPANAYQRSDRTTTLSGGNSIAIALPAPTP